MHIRILCCVALALSACSDDDNGPDDQDPPTDEQPDVPLYTSSIVSRTLQVEGSDASSRLALRLQLGGPVILEVDVGDDGLAEERFDITQFDNIVVNGNGGDDVVRIDEANGIFTVSKVTTINGGAGNDSLIGGSGSETLTGGDGDDSVVGGIGVDAVHLGGGNDSFFWTAGQGSDVVEGGEGDDTLTFTGTDAPDAVAVAVNGEAMRFAWGSVAIDATHAEFATLEPLGGTDTVSVGDMLGIGFKALSVDLRSGAGSTGDGVLDTVTFEGTSGQDTVTVLSESGRTVVGSSRAEVGVKGYEESDLVLLDATGGDLISAIGTVGADQIIVSANAPLVHLGGTAYSAGVDISGYATTDTLVVMGREGADEISATGNLAVLVMLRLEGGEGDDVLLGGNGADIIMGGPGNDRIDGNASFDTVFMGEGDDTAQWDPGDGNEILEGEGGNDVLVFNASNASENISLTANGARALLLRDIANVTVDLNDLEEVTVRALGGVDSILLADMTGTDVVLLNVDLSATGGTAADGAVDTVTLNGTPNADAIQVSTNAGAVLVAGLPTAVTITHPDLTDVLIVNALGGADMINVDAAVSGVMVVTSNP